ncbi:ABC transporter ATP-binding protein [Streptomyces sp. 378]|uniref:ABC transporter ATP-binding protein n=1 Tax=Streptomyces sp. 378 TaxID=3049412 RepID=UPI0024C4112E|nr:ABC transporter ATP-binding protein [Streptomyces sp. 378]MDK1344012.1 ABC transporter ATP-binding protein [Streptomyces sp. 378]
MIDAYEEPGTPDDRSGARYLWWLVARQPGRCAAGAMFGSVWMVLLAATPYLMSRAIDDGLEPGDMRALALWSGALFAVGAFNAWLSIMRHRTMTRVRMDANFRTVKVVVGQAVRLGASLRRQAGAGEVVTIGVSDVQTVSQSLTVVGPGVGAVLGYLVIALLLVSVSGFVALIVLLGIPVLALVMGPLLGRLQGSEAEYRARQGVLTARIGDLAGGLRVLAGLGGKQLVADAFLQDSRRLREQGYRVGAVTSWVQALGVGLPTLFLAVVTWLAARLAAQGGITVGQLVSVYGYVAVLVWPVAFLVECGYQISRGLVCARRVVRFLRLEPMAGSGTLDAPSEPSALYDPESGVRILPGRLTALVAEHSADATTVVDRLGRFVPSSVTWGDTRLDDIALNQIRSRILVSDHEADLFAGALSHMLGVQGTSPGGAGNCADHHNAPAATPPDHPALRKALHTAAAEDIVQALPHGLDTLMDAQARNLSGGQRQRIRLARALLTDPEILLAIEPTSALDAHTEATVATRLRKAREGRTTVVTTTSPLVLDRTDTVHYLRDGKVEASGTHHELLVTTPGYRTLVARDAEEALG